MQILADRRESPSLIQRVQSLGVEVEIRQLPVADFIISQHIGIERKTVPDFLQSLIDGRLLNQARDLSENFERPILVLEGGGLYAVRDIHPNAVRGALAALAADLGISVVPTEDEDDTAHFLAVLARRARQPPREPPLRPKRLDLPLPLLQRFIVEGLPRVSTVLADRLLRHFGSVEAVMRAPERRLMEVVGIGKKRAREIRAVLTAPYRPESHQRAP
jgi:Fanconi anemia group M protein